MAFRTLGIRWHGRGGYGVKTAAMLLAEAVIDAGGWAQASPEFGPERRGAPVQAFTRIGPAPIARRGPIERPDLVVVFDARLLSVPAVLTGVGPQTSVVLNAPAAPDIPGVPRAQVVAANASAIARRTLGRDVPNIPLLAVVVTLFTPLERDSFLAWLRRRLGSEFRPDVVEANLRAARGAIEEAGNGGFGDVAAT
ncbi:MAG: 2-oxoacid:acceptor oxidoreductase family protein [Armatimonadota bacterium]|nr:2-oxoacid:acceptor oxidoreductase family protein [Armatimonadota bacterium]MDR5697550.1 2-oxoacid:acceptor oxidoreductase family protein [Armatimonadota bacterium]